MQNFCKKGKLTSWAQGMGCGLKNKQGLNMLTGDEETALAQRQI
jgi:hypothetical protein